MGNIMSDLVDWTTRIMLHGENIQAEIMIYGTFIALSVIVSYMFARYFMNNKNTYSGDNDVELDGKIEEMKNHSKAVKMMEAAYYNLNFKSGFKAMIYGKYRDMVSQDNLMLTIHFLEEMMKRNTKFRLKLNEFTYPLVQDLCEDKNIPCELELEDAIAMMMMIKQSFGQHCYLFKQKLQNSQTIYPDRLEKRIEKIKPILANFEELITLYLELDDNDTRKNMLNMLRKGKIRLLQNELRQLERVMKKKSEEYFDSLPKGPRPADAEEDIEIPEYFFN